ncbi:MAG: OmpA family protein, partial [Planktomarina sp.]
QSLENFGHFALEDLSFATGADALSDDDVPSLVELAEYLSANPHRTITLVGHTDSTGAAAANLALSQKRARAVRSVLIDRYGIDADRIKAEGVGDLAPRASNSTDEGRRLNRRVEVIIRATE